MKLSKACQGLTLGSKACQGLTLGSKACQGLTLVETLITLSISVIIGTILVSLIVNSSGLQLQQGSKVSEGLGLNDALSKIRAAVKSTDSVAVDYPETPPASFSSNASQLVLKIPTTDVSGNLVQGSFDYYIYYLSGSFLKEKVVPGSQSKNKALDQILAKNVKSVVFDYLSINNVVVSPSAAAKIKISLQLSEQVGIKNQVQVSTSEAALRNF